MDLKKNEKFNKLSEEISDNFDTCVVLASDIDDKQYTSFLNGHGEQVAALIAELLLQDPALHTAVLEDVLANGLDDGGNEDD